MLLQISGSSILRADQLHRIFILNLDNKLEPLGNADTTHDKPKLPIVLADKVVTFDEDQELLLQFESAKCKHRLCECLVGCFLELVWLLDFLELA